LKKGKLKESAWTRSYVEDYFHIGEEVIIHGYMETYTGAKEYLCEAHVVDFMGARANLELMGRRPYTNFSGRTQQQCEAHHANKEVLYMWILEKDMEYVREMSGQPNKELKQTLRTLDDI